MNLKKIKALAFALSLLCCVAVFAACDSANSQPQIENNHAEDSAYRVTVVDAFGEPVTEGVIVRFMQNGQQASMQVVGKDGVASKELEAGEYAVELKFTDTDAVYHYDETVTLTSENRQAQITLYNAVSGEPQILYGPSLKSEEYREHEAYAVEVGGTYVELEAGERNYFLFTPTEPGLYEISVQNCDATVGYYGAPHFVQNISSVEPVDNVVSVSIKAGMIGTNGTGTSVLVIGLDAAKGVTSGILTVRRAGDPAWSIEDEPWHVYSATHELKNYTLPADASFGEFDLKATSDTYKLVLDGNGYYHLDSADGPLVLVRLGKNSGGSKYLPSFETILEHSGVTKYFFDDAGNFVKKESYSECLLEYMGYMDPDAGVYPLTEDLKYIIQMRGDHYGWFDATKPGYIFVDGNGNPIVGINQDISWLFMCCYLEN